jgi:hypothetical protein
MAKGVSDAESRLVKVLQGVADELSLHDTAILQGYLRDLNSEHWRLYLTPTFTEYVDIPKGDLLYHLEASDDLLSLTYVWVRRDAKLLHTVVRSAHQEADFLQGQITFGYLPIFGPQSGVARLAREREIQSLYCPTFGGTCETWSATLNKCLG